MLTASTMMCLLLETSNASAAQPHQPWVRDLFDRAASGKWQGTDEAVEFFHLRDLPQNPGLCQVKLIKIQSFQIWVVLLAANDLLEAIPLSQVSHQLGAGDHASLFGKAVVAVLDQLQQMLDVLITDP